jgi:ectoine hydroxylase-related dioxygenase (phytanoyl-CoA dioxygenase family)
MDQLKSHAVRELHHNVTEDDASAEEIRNIGYTVVDGGLSERELQLMRDKIDRVYELQVKQIGGEDKLKLINDANVGRCLIGYDDYFINLAAHPRIISITTALLGDYFVLMSQNAIVNNPTDEHYQITWHRDLNYQHFVSSRPLAISALVCIDEFTEETGGTFVLPASHKSEVFPSQQYVLNHQTTIEAPPGSLIIFDSMVFHRSGNNRSGRLRRAVNHIYTLPLIKQQISLPRMLNGKFSDDPFLSKLLGYESETGETVQLWRENKLRLAQCGEKLGEGSSVKIRMT